MRIIMPNAKPERFRIYPEETTRPDRPGRVVTLDEMPPKKREEMLRIYGNMRANALHDQTVSEVMTEIAEDYFPGLRFVPA